MFTQGIIKNKGRLSMVFVFPLVIAFVIFICSFRMENKSFIFNDLRDKGGNFLPLIQDQDTSVYTMIDEYPRFPDGDVLLSDFIKKNLKYPEECKEKGIEGSVMLLAIVEKDGSILNVRVLKSVDPLLDKEAIRIVKSFPKFLPGKLHGNPVRVNEVFPILFKL
jgi:TonB family protein